MLKIREKIKNDLHARQIRRTLRSLDNRVVEPAEFAFTKSNLIMHKDRVERWIRPHLFERYNDVFHFSVRFQYFNSRPAQDDIQSILQGLIETRECGTQNVFFKWVDGISASKSEGIENFNKWENFFDHGKYAYEEYLPNDRDKASEGFWDKHYQRLADLFEKLRRGERGISAFVFQEWCGRYYIANTGVARRSAAIAYLAKLGREEFDKPIAYPLIEKSIDWGAIEKIESIADTYVMVASEGFHEGLELIVDETNAPLGVCTSTWLHDRGQEKDVRIYLLLGEEYLNRSINSHWERGRKEQNRYDAYVYQRRVLKPQLDSLKEVGLAVSLRQYVDLVSDVWRRNSYGAQQSLSRMTEC